MARMLLSAAVACALVTPAFAQNLEVTCGDYTLMDNTKQMETIAALESETSQMDGGEALTADQIHEKLAAECKDKVDVLVVDVVKGW